MRRMPARILRWMAVLGGLTLLVFPLAASPEFLFDASLRRVEKTRARLARHLADRRGLLHAMTFDEPVPNDFFSERSFVYSGTVAGPGRYGQALKFDGRERTQVETPLRWDRIGSSFTLSFWVKIPRGRPDQCIWYRAQGGQLGFHLEEGRMAFDLPTAAGDRQCVAYPFERYGKFVHLAATADAEQGRMVLYEDGLRKAEGPFTYEGLPQANMAFGKHTWYANRNPFRGWIDEATVWGRVLPEKEIRRLAQSRRGVLWAWGGSSRYLKWRLAQTRLRMLRAFAGWADGLAPATPQGRRELRAIQQLPELRVTLSGKVRRELIAAHRRSRMSGRRTQSGARPRPAHVAFDGQVHPAWIRLAGGDMEYADGARAGYEVELQDGAQILGARRLRLCSPESGAWLYPLVDARLRTRSGLPAVSNGLCRLRINGLAIGTYLFSNDDRGGILPGDFRETNMDAVRHPIQWNLLFHRERWREWAPPAARAAWPLTLREMQAIYDAVVGEWGGCLRGDPQDPLSRKEITWLLAQGRDRIASLWPPAPEDQPPARTIAEFLDEFLVLGSNASPDRLVAPLDLGRTPFREPGIQIRWRSSNPSVLGANGEIYRPAEGGPIGVQLVATVDDGKEIAEKALSFRVMPQRIALAALFLNVRSALDKTRRADAVVEICEPGEDFPSRTLFATQGARGGIEHRGNSSYWKVKKLFSIKTDAPHRFFDESERRVLLAVNSLQDSTFVRNRLAYGLFRSWGTEEAPRLAPETRYAEVFMNGRYYGLFEIGERIDEDLLDDGDSPPDEDSGSPRWIIYRHESLSPRTSDMRARRPAEQNGDFSGPYREFERFLERPTDAAWERELARRLDLANLADYQLLLNLFQNRNGYPFHFLLHEALAYDVARQTFFHVPWDFETGARRGDWLWLRSGLMERLEWKSPQYAALLAARWRELRGKDGVTPAALDARVDEAARLLRGYVEWDYLRWSYHPKQEWDVWLEDLKVLLRESAEHMDAYVERLSRGEIPPAAGAAPARMESDPQPEPEPSGPLETQENRSRGPVPVR